VRIKVNGGGGASAGRKAGRHRPCDGVPARAALPISIGVFTQSAGQCVKGPHRGKRIGYKTDTLLFNGEPPSGRGSRAGLSAETDMA
jgi:hypothetical protein